MYRQGVLVPLHDNWWVAQYYVDYDNVGEFILIYPDCRDKERAINYAIMNGTCNAIEAVLRIVSMKVMMDVMELQDDLTSLMKRLDSAFLVKLREHIRDKYGESKDDAIHRLSKLFDEEALDVMMEYGLLSD